MIKRKAKRRIVKENKYMGFYSRFNLFTLQSANRIYFYINGPWIGPYLLNSIRLDTTKDREDIMNFKYSKDANFWKYFLNKYLCDVIYYDDKNKKVSYVLKEEFIDYFMKNIFHKGVNEIKEW